MRAAITPLPNTPSWRGAQLKKKHGQLCLYLNYIRTNVVLIMFTTNILFY